MSWLSNANLSSLKSQLSSLAKEVLADVEETVREVSQEEVSKEDKTKKDGNVWSQVDLVTSGDKADSVSYVSGSLEDEKAVLLKRIQELTSKLQKKNSDASTQSSQLQRQNEELEIQLKILQGDKESASQRIRALEKFEKEAKELRQQAATLHGHHAALEQQHCQLGDELEKVRKDAQTQQKQLDELVKLKSEFDHLKELHDDLEATKLSEIKQLLEAKEEAETKMNNLLDELAVFKVEERRLLEHSAFPTYDELFDKITNQIQGEGSESAVSFVRKLEGFLKDITSSGSSSKSSIDALEDGLAQLAAYEEFDLVKSPKDTTTQTESSSVSDSGCKTPLASESTPSQTEWVDLVDVMSQTESDKVVIRSIDSQTPLFETVDAVIQTHNALPVLESIGLQTESVTETATKPTMESSCSQTDVIDGYTTVKTTTDTSSGPAFPGLIETSCQVSVQSQDISTSYDLFGVDTVCQTEESRDTQESQTDAAQTADRFTSCEATFISSDCQTDTVDYSDMLIAARPILNSFKDTAYDPIVSKLISELNQVKSVDRTLALFMDLIFITYKQLSSDLETKMSLQTQVGKFQTERNQLIQALQQKHQESLSYHSEVQKLSRALQENARKRVDVAEVSIQFNGFSDMQEEIAQLREREVLLTAEAINLKQTVEQIRNRHNLELLNLKEKLNDADEKLLTSHSNQHIEQKCTLLTKRLNTLQQALDAIHKEKETEIQEATQRLRKQLESADREKQYLHEEITALKVQVSDLEERLDKTEELNEQLTKHRGTISSLQVNLERNEKQRSELQLEIKRLKDASANHVDRYLVANLVCGYISAPANHKQRVLNLLSAVLNFTPEEKIKCGLVEQQQVDVKTLSTAFLQFLEAESKARPKLPPLAHYPS